MEILVPIDGSDCSFRALEYAAELADHHDGTLHVVHITDHEGEATAELLDRARETLETAGLEGDPEVRTDLRMADPRYANRVGKEVISLVDERGYDHVVMGHHGTGRIERAILGSAAETVVRGTTVPCTIVP